MSRLRLAPIMLLCSIATACGDGGGTPCVVAADCASGFCRADGTCGPAEADAAPDHDAAPDGPSGLCAPDHDGSVTAAELPLVAGKMATFRVATGATFDTAGVASSTGTRHWDLSTQLTGDVDRTIALASPVGAWWAARFPSASYATTLAAGSDLLGVFRVDGAQLVLLGVVSPEAGSFRTELAYEPPAQLLALPVSPGGAWSSTSTVTGTAQGVPVVYSERYASLADAVGTLATPYGEFPVLRVATDLTRTSGLTTLVTKRSFGWLAECFGTVATVASQDFEASAEFADPAEVRRLAP